MQLKTEYVRAHVCVCISHIKEGETVADKQPVLACGNSGGILDADEVFLKTSKHGRKQKGQGQGQTPYR